MKNKKYHTVGTKSNRKIVERGKLIPLTHKYMTAHFPGLVQYFNKKCRGMLVFYEPKESLDSDGQQFHQCQRNGNSNHWTQKDQDGKRNCTDSLPLKKTTILTQLEGQWAEPRGCVAFILLWGNLIQNLPWVLPTKFRFIWLSSFRGEDF
jgi:hypothetical protein